MIPMAYGGFQEKALRPGTENVPGMSGWAQPFDTRKITWPEKANGRRSCVII